MAGIFAKLDNQDKIVSLERKHGTSVEEELNLNLDKLKDYINKYGYIKIEINTKQLESYIELYVKKYFKKNEKDMRNILSGVLMPFGMGSLIVSNYGLLILYEKPVEEFTDVNGHEHNFYDNFEHFSSTPSSKKKAKGKVKAEVEAEVKAEVEVETETQIANVQEIKHGDTLTVLLPKVYFSNEREVFIDFLMSELPKSGANIDDVKKTFIFVKAMLKKVNETPNPEIKIANTVGLLVRMGLIVTFTNLLKQNYSSDEKTEILAGLFSENLEDIPYDECVFYNDKLNFIKFTPNICAKAKEEKEIKLKQMYQTEKKCPVPEKLDCSKSQEQKCPEQEQPVSNLWKYTSVILIITVIVLVTIMLFKNSGLSSNIKNLAKLK